MAARQVAINVAQCNRSQVSGLTTCNLCCNKIIARQVAGKKLPGVKEVLTAAELIPNEARNMRQGYMDGENLLINFLDLPTFPLPFHWRKLLR